MTAAIRRSLSDCSSDCNSKNTSGPATAALMFRKGLYLPCVLD
jgi:hypothetical protein